jgi:hypothetical protein
VPPGDPAARRPGRRGRSASMRVGTTRAALRLWWRLRRAGTPGDGSAVRGVEALAVTAYAVATRRPPRHPRGVARVLDPTPGRAHRGLLGVRRPRGHGDRAARGAHPHPRAGWRPRLTLGRRDARLAALRLAGATSGQVGVMALADAAAQAALGAVLGVGGYALAIPGLALVSFQGRPPRGRRAVARRGAAARRVFLGGGPRRRLRPDQHGGGRGGAARGGPPDHARAAAPVAARARGRVAGAVALRHPAAGPGGPRRAVGGAGGRRRWREPRGAAVRPARRGAGTPGWPGRPPGSSRRGASSTTRVRRGGR